MELNSSILLSHNIAILSGLTVLICTLVNVVKQLFLSEKSVNPPVVFHWIPILGSAISYGRDPLKFLESCRKKHGDIFTFILFGKKVTVVLGSHGNNFVLGGHTTIFNAEDVYSNLTTPIFGKDVAYDVPNHIFMEQKKFLKFGLTNEHFREYVGLIEDEVQMYSQMYLLPEHCIDSDEWRTFDSLRVMEEITILTAAKTLLGKEVRANLDTSFSALYNDLDAGFIPINLLLSSFPLPVNRRRDRAQQKMSQFFIDIIRKRKLRSSSEEPDNDMIQSLMGRTYKDGRRLQDHEVAHMLIGLLMAGQHTSSSTAAWILLHLAAHPTWAEQLFDEQVQYFGTADGTLRSMTYDEFKDLPLMNAVICETLRMHPPIHSILRNVREPVSVPHEISSHSYIVPRGHYVLASPLVSQMDSRYWNEPDVWSPYRWLNSESGVLGDQQSERQKNMCVSKATDSFFQPFGSGRHRCIGERFAHLQLGTIIATIIRQYELRTETGVPCPNYQTMIICPNEPRNIAYRRRLRS